MPLDITVQNRQPLDRRLQYSLHETKFVQQTFHKKHTGIENRTHAIKKLSVFFGIVV